MKSDFRIKLFSLAVLLAILCSGNLIKLYLNEDSKKLLVRINTIQTSIERNNWSSAIKTSEKLHDQWSRSETIWGFFINHHEIDNITISVKKSISYIKNKDHSNSNAYLSELAEFIEHIPEIETVSFKTVF